MARTSGEQERRTTERQIALLMMLLHARRGYTAEQIRRDVEGYQGLDDENFEKSFQRDRALLHDIGVPLAVDRPEEGPARYSVDAQDLVLPEIDFSPAERRALLHAREVWSEARLQSEVMRAVGLFVDPGATEEHGRGLPRIVRRITPGLELFLDAAVEQQTLSFGYRTAAGETTPKGRPRRMRVWSALEVGGRWYAAGWDLDRRQERLFRITRVIGTPKRLTGADAEDAPSRPAGWNPADIRDRLLGRGEGERDRIRLWVAPGRGHSVRLRADAVDPESADGAAPGEGWELFEMDRPAHDGLEQVCGQLMGVVQPSAADPALAAEVHEAWGSVRDRHAGDPDLSVLPALKRPSSPRLRPGQRDRVGRLLDIVGLANRSGGITKAELRERLELSADQLDRDLRDLTTCGLPEREFPGWLFDVDPESEIVEVLQSKDLPAPIRLSTPEAHRLTAALDLVARMPHRDEEIGPAAVTAAARLRELLDDAGQPRPDGRGDLSVDPSLAAVPGGDAPDPGEGAAVGTPDAGEEPFAATPVTSFWDVQADPQTVRALMDAVDRSRLVRLRYHSLHTDEVTEREVEPVQLVQSGVLLYLQGHCRRAGGMRTFRVERMSGVEVLEETVRARRRPAKAVLAPEAPAVPAVLAWAHRIRDVADDYTPDQETVDADGRRITRVRLVSEDSAVALVAAHAGDLEVLEPAQLRHAVRERAAAAMQRLETAVRW